MRSGCNDIDSLIGGYLDNKMNIIYGESATGKTTLALLFAIEQARQGKKILFFDIEDSFSVERFKQLSNNEQGLLERIIFVKIKNFKEQCDRICNLENLKNIDIIIIDTIGIYYRLELKRDARSANNEINRQMKVLKSLANKGASILLTNQVYTNIDTNEICLVGGNMMKDFADLLIELDKNQKRILKVKRPYEKEMFFEIKKEGVFKI